MNSNQNSHFLNSSLNRPRQIDMIIIVKQQVLENINFFLKEMINIETHTDFKIKELQIFQLYFVLAWIFSLLNKANKIINHVNLEFDHHSMLFFY